MEMNLFKRTKKEENTKNDFTDRELLQSYMERIIKGDIIGVDSSKFSDQLLGETFNKMLTVVKSKNNEYVMRLNNIMELATNNTIVSDMLGAVNAQTTAIDLMTQRSNELGKAHADMKEAVSNIKHYVDETVETSMQSVDHMTQSVKGVEVSTKKMKNINEKMLSFKAQTDKITGIVTIVKQVAEQSNLLALNASIEAARAGEVGRGFAVVAEEVKKLSNNTKASADDIVHDINQLQEQIDELVLTIGEANNELSEGNKRVQQSINEIELMNAKMTTINEEIDSIYKGVKVQDDVSKTFVESAHQMGESYTVLESYCNEVGSFLFKMARSTDMVRGSMARYTASLKNEDWLRVFEVDHMIFVWRLHNAVEGYEQLEIVNLNNPKGCKLGKWCEGVEDETLKSKPAFKAILREHSRLHELAVACFYEIERGNKSQAHTYYEEARIVLSKLLEAIGELKRYIG